MVVGLFADQWMHARSCQSAHACVFRSFTRFACVRASVARVRRLAYEHVHASDYARDLACVVMFVHVRAFRVPLSRASNGMFGCAYGG